MTRRLISVGEAKPLLDIASYARRGPGCRDHVSQQDIELIDRTVRRTPEVMVKVLTQGGKDLKAVGRHFAYLNREGDLDIETDDGQRLSGKGVEEELLENWDLDLEERSSGGLEYWSRRAPPKLVHKLLFSMPAGTPADKVLAAVKNFATEEFGLKHRYAMVLHTDEPHPHVHMVVKAVSEQGERLNIRKATLREWRRGFAKYLRALGVPANATERAVRGAPSRKSDGIYRAEGRGASTHYQSRTESLALNLARGTRAPETGKTRLLGTRSEVLKGWIGLAEALTAQREPGLAQQVRQFIHEMPPVKTDRELMAERLSDRESRRSREELGSLEPLG